MLRALKVNQPSNSTTVAGISGIAGNTNVRTGNAQTGLKNTFNAAQVLSNIQAQVAITQEFGKQASATITTYTNNQLKQLQDQLKNTSNPNEKTALQDQVDQVKMENRVLNVLVGAVTGLGGSAVTQQTLNAAADEMRQLSIQSSSKFAGVTDGTTTISNISGTSEGIGFDGVKLGGTRIDLDKLCGAGNINCETNPDGSLLLNAQGQVKFASSVTNADGSQQTLAQFLASPAGKVMEGSTGGIQGAQGTLFGVPYSPGSWQDNLIEAFAGTHDMIGGQLSGLYDAQGNATRGRGTTETALQNAWSASGAIVLSTPFAAAQGLPPEVWNAISILLKGAK